MSNIEEDNAELALLNAQIDKIKSQIAERDAHKQEAMNVQPKTRVGWASYIIDNDRGLLDKYADAERAWQTARQQSIYSKELAEAQRIEKTAYNRDEWQLNLQKAQNELSAARTALAIANKNGDEEAINTAEQTKANAKASVDYWSKRLGLAPATMNKVSNNEESPKDDKPRVNIEAILATAKAKFKDNLTKSEIAEQLKILEPYTSQNSEAATLYHDFSKKKSKESKDFEDKVLNAAIVLAGGRNMWKSHTKEMRDALIAEAKAKLSKGAK